MERPSIQSIVGKHRPVKPWHCESYTDIYGTYLVDELNEACVNLILTRDNQSIPWVNGLDALVANMIGGIPVMLSILIDTRDFIDIPPEIRDRINRLLTKMNTIPGMPEVRTKKKRKYVKSNHREKPLLLGELTDETEV